VILVQVAAYRYPGTTGPALRQATLELRAGEVIGVTGANETGKTTLCLVASGLAPVVIGGELTGRVLIDGRATTDLSSHELAQRCGVLFDNPATQITGLYRTVFEEVAFGPCNLGLPVGEVLDRAGEVLSLLGLEHLAERDPQRLSGGEAQLTVLAGLLALRPAHLVLDEPTSRLDPARSALVETAISRQAESGVATLVTSHDGAMLARVCGRILELGA
jgi:energy-coupling factor transporter ATP-binding protein EcfA2